MKILILNWRDPKHPLAGGAEISLLEQAKYWKKMGAQITWFASSFKNGKEKEVYDDIRIIRKGNHYTNVLFFIHAWLSGKYRNIDILIDCFHFIPFLTPLYAKNSVVIGLINEVAGDLWFKNLVFPLAALGKFLEPFVIRLYKGKIFITGSESTRRELINVGLDSKKLFVVHHGFNRLILKKKFVKEKIPTVLFLGRLSKDKGIEDALYAVKYLIKKRIRIKLWAVGKPENDLYYKKLLSLANNLEIKDDCEFFGYLSETEKAEKIKKAWILIHTSIKEGWGLNVIEAGSLGTPSIGYDVPGLRDSIIHNKTGILVRNDPHKLAEAVKILIKEKAKLRRLGKGAEKWSANFSWSRAGRESYKILQQAYGKTK